MRKKLLLWDIDGTLMHCGNDGTKALNETIYQLYGYPNAFGEIKIGTALDSVLLDRIMKHFQIHKKEKNTIIQGFSKNLKEILAANEKKRVLPGIKEILEVLEPKNNIFMGLSTSNFKVGADLKLDSVGLLNYFSFGGYGDYYGEKWDAAALAIQTAEAMSGGAFEKSNIYLIGDTWYDIICAEKLGIQSIAVGTGWTEYDELKAAKPNYLFQDLENCEQFLKIIETENK